MNQILVTQKVYVTPELRRKRKLYRIEFVASVLLVIALFSYYIYAEYDRSRKEAYAEDILASLDDNDESKDLMIFALDNNNVIEDTSADGTTSEFATKTVEASNGVHYTTEAELNIPSLGINYPVLSDTSDELLKVSLNKYWGPSPNAIGNYCIVGHNYKSGKMFGKLSQIEMGALCTLEDVRGNTVTYKVYDKFVVDPSDVSCTSQLTNGQKILTLITCTNYGQQRLVVKARAV